MMSSVYIVLIVIMSTILTFHIFFYLLFLAKGFLLFHLLFPFGHSSPTILCSPEMSSMMGRK